MNQHDLKAAAIVRAAMEVNQTNPRPADLPARLRQAGIPRAAQDAVIAATAAGAQQQVQEQAEVAAELQQEAARRIATYQDGIVRAMLRERLARGELPTDNPHELDQLNRLQKFLLEDSGATRYELDGQELVTFAPAEAGFDGAGGFLEVRQVFRVAL